MNHQELRVLQATAAVALHTPASKPNVKTAARAILEGLGCDARLVQLAPCPSSLPTEARDFAHMALDAVMSTRGDPSAQCAALAAAGGALGSCFPSVGLTRRVLDVVDAATAAGCDATILLAAVRPWGALRGEVGEMVRRYPPLRTADLEELGRQSGVRDALSERMRGDEIAPVRMVLVKKPG